MRSAAQTLLCLTRYDSAGSSSRYRFYQFVPGLEARGWRVTVSPLLGDGYVEELYASGRASKRSLVLGASRRLRALARARSYDAVWIEKELVPWTPDVLEHVLRWAGVPYAVDYDDAVFHLYDVHRSRAVRAVLGRKIDRIMAGSALVTAGNEYLAQRARDAGAARVEIVPTVIDLDRYEARGDRAGDGPLCVGWIGSPSTQYMLATLAPVLARFCAEFGAVVRAVGAHPSFQLAGVPLEVVPWSEATETAELARMDIGVMPLADDAFSRGKCGLKLIQYMGCAVPVVASRAAANDDIVAHGACGRLAGTAEEWLAALRALAADPALRHRLGLAGRARVEARYSVAAVLPRLDALLRGLSRPAVATNPGVG